LSKLAMGYMTELLLSYKMCAFLTTKGLKGSISINFFILSLCFSCFSLVASCFVYSFSFLRFYNSLFTYYYNFPFKGWSLNSYLIFVGSILKLCFYKEWKGFKSNVFLSVLDWIFAIIISFLFSIESSGS